MMRQELISPWQAKIPSARLVEELSLREKEQMAMEYSNRGHLYLPMRGGNGQVTLFTWPAPLLNKYGRYTQFDLERIDVDLDELLSWYKAMKRDGSSKLKNRVAAQQLFKCYSEWLTAFLKGHPPLRMQLIRQAGEFCNSPNRFEANRI